MADSSRNARVLDAVPLCNGLGRRTSKQRERIARNGQERPQDTFVEGATCSVLQKYALIATCREGLDYETRLQTLREAARVIQFLHLKMRPKCHALEPVTVQHHVSRGSSASCD